MPIFFSLLIQYELFFENFVFNKSFPIIRINNPIGVIMRKKTIAITMGAINLPRISPNLIQAKFRGPNIFEFNIPKNKKIKETTRDQILIV